MNEGGLCLCEFFFFVFFFSCIVLFSSAALPPPSVIADSITSDSMSLSFSLNSQYDVRVNARLRSPWCLRGLAVTDESPVSVPGQTVRGHLLLAV